MNREVHLSPIGLEGLLDIPDRATGLVIFAHGSGSSRHSPRNKRVATALQRAGYATLLLDLLTEAEAADRAKVFDIGLLASRLAMAEEWALQGSETSGLPIGFFGSSTGAAAAIAAAALPGADVAAIVSRGGRPDLADAALSLVRAPTLLIVGGRDTVVMGLNRKALSRLAPPKELAVVPGAGHLFEEPGTMDQVIGHAIRWFDLHLKQAEQQPSPPHDRGAPSKAAPSDPRTAAPDN